MGMMIIGEHPTLEIFNTQTLDTAPIRFWFME